jgi:hypothetical protein
MVPLDPGVLKTYTAKVKLARQTNGKESNKTKKVE